MITGVHLSQIHLVCDQMGHYAWSRGGPRSVAMCLFKIAYQASRQAEWLEVHVKKIPPSRRYFPGHAFPHLAGWGGWDLGAFSPATMQTVASLIEQLGGGAAEFPPIALSWHSLGELPWAGLPGPSDHSPTNAISSDEEVP